MIDDDLRTPTGSLNPLYQQYERQQCFVGYSLDTSWHEDLTTACKEVLEEFNMEPWYATEHFAPTQSLREKVVEMIANTHYGVYDISQWRKGDKGEWHMPRNVFIELGIALALNRPILMLRHTNNRIAELPLPECLKSISTSIIEFSGLASLKRSLRERLSQLQQTEPEKDWWNRYCTFGDRMCEYREAHPHLRQWSQEKLHCHISDGRDFDRDDFRAVVEEVLQRFDDVNFRYLDAWQPLPQGYTFLLCGLCQTIRSSPFAIYRISDQTPAETFLAIGMNLALETQFEQKIPKILLTAHAEDIPSLLAGYDVVVAQNDHERLFWLRKFTPNFIHQVRKTTWKARPLPFIEVRPDPDKLSASENPLDYEATADYLAHIGKYGIVKEIDRSEIAIIYLVRNTESHQLYHMKRLHSGLTSDSKSVTHFHREADILSRLHSPYILHAIEQGEDSMVPYFVMEYVEGQTLTQLIKATGKMDPVRAINYAHQITEGLDEAYRLEIIHRNLQPENILVDSQDQIKITGFGSAHEVDDRNSTQANEISFYSIAPEVAFSSRSADIRSDLYALAVVFFHMLASRPPFEGDSPFTVLTKHVNEQVPSLCLMRPDLLGIFDLFMQKAMAKSPNDRYQTPTEFAAALDNLLQAIALTPPGNHTHIPVNAGNLSTRGLPAIVGKTLSQYRVFDYLGSNGLSDVFKAYEPALDRVVALKDFSSTIFSIPTVLPTESNWDEVFVKEMRDFTRLSHPHLVSIYDCGIENGMLYSVEELIDGDSFKWRLKAGIEQKKGIEWIIQAAEGLAYLHQNDLVHQDVQPGNMLLDGDNRLLHSNWATLNAFTAAQIQLIYPATYPSPEQLAGQSVSHLSNIYSLGIILFECLAARVPFTSTTNREQFPIWYLRSAHIAVEIQQVVVKMMQIVPEERYLSMQEVIDALQPLLVVVEGVDQEEGNLVDVVGLDRCAFCDAATIPADELCSNCGRRLMPETPALMSGRQPPSSYNMANGWEQPSFSSPDQTITGWGQSPSNYNMANGWGQSSFSYNQDATVKLYLCPSCGEDLQPGDVSCPHCGLILTFYGTPSDATVQPNPELPAAYVSPFPQTRYCPACGAANPPGSAFCEKCGCPSPVPQVATLCLQCGVIVRAGDKYCMNCGHSLLASAQPPQIWPVSGDHTASADPWAQQPSSKLGAPQSSEDPWSVQPPLDSWGAQPSTNPSSSWGTQPSANPWSTSGWGAQPSTCPYCAAATRPDDAFCLNCGRKTIAAVPTQSLQSAPGPEYPTIGDGSDKTIPASDDWGVQPAVNPSPPSGDLSGQFGPAWTGGISHSTFSLEDLNNIGKTFGGYRILREIGQGGLGRVYLALNAVSYQPVAVKLFYSHLDAKQLRNLFFLEAQVLDHLRHPYILSIIEVNLQANPHYLITEYASLGSLHERIQSGQPLSTESAMAILSQIGEALAHIHQHNIVHRDLKPGNILFNERNEALLSDFDIAVVLDTGSNKKVNKWGSPPYMAPEQFEGIVSRQSDQYSLGCIAYRLFTGKRPFDDNNFMALQYQHMTQQPIAPRQLNPSIPGHIEQAILKALAKNPAQRHADVLAFISALATG